MTTFTTRDFSFTATTSPTQVFATGQLAGQSLSYMRIYNVSSGTTIWCSRSGVAAVNAQGSFPLGSGNYELWQAPNNVPVNGLSIVAASGTAPVTVEIG
jgi:hypothetical protein